MFRKDFLRSLNILCVHKGKVIKNNSMDLEEGPWKRAENNGKRHNKEEARKD